MSRIMARLACIACVSCFILTSGRAAAEDRSSQAAIEYLPAQQIASLEHPDILESSGLASSRQSPNVFWTHNDSGDSARIFAFNRRGKHLGVWPIDGAAAVDWEDMASFVRRGTDWLLLADVGDNAKRRKDYQLYLVREPQLHQSSVSVQAVVRFRYPGGSRDCEAVAVDSTTGTVLLATKSVFQAELFGLSLPSQPTDQILVAKRLAPLAVPLATAMDVTSDGRRAIVLTYGHAYEFARADDEDWATAFTRKGRLVKMPSRRQGESICYGRHDQAALYLTSEQFPTPLWKLTPRETPNSE